MGILLLTLATLGASSASPKRILILDPFGRDVAPFSAAVSAFRTTLARELGESVDFYEVPLDLARFDGPDGEGPVVTFLEGRIKSRPVDLVVPIGGAGGSLPRGIANAFSRTRQFCFSHRTLGWCHPTFCARMPPS